MKDWRAFFLEVEQCWWFISTHPILSLNYTLQIIIFLESVLNIFCIVKIILVNRVRQVLVFYLNFQRSLIIQVPKMKRLACSETKFLCPKQSLALQAYIIFQYDNSIVNCSTATERQTGRQLAISSGSHTSRVELKLTGRIHCFCSVYRSLRLCKYG